MRLYTLGKLIENSNLDVRYHIKLTNNNNNTIKYVTSCKHSNVPFIWSCCDHFLHRLPLMTIGANWNGMRRGVLTPFNRVRVSPFIVVSSKCQIGSRRNYGFSTVAAEKNRILQGSDII